MFEAESAHPFDRLQSNLPYRLAVPIAAKAAMTNAEPNPASHLKGRCVRLNLSDAITLGTSFLMH